MRVGIIGPSKIKDREKISQISKIIAELGLEVVLTPDKDSSSEFFAQEYSRNNGKKIYEVVPLEDKEFGNDWVNFDLGEHINCGTWRNQPEKLNEESDILISLGYSTGGLIEICYSKWFKPKTIYILKELISQELPKEIEESLDLRYVSIGQLEKELNKNA